MKRKLYSTGILLGLAALLFYGASTTGKQYGIQASLESTTFAEQNFQMPVSKIQALKTEIAKRKKQEEEIAESKRQEAETARLKKEKAEKLARAEEEIRTRYGNYRIMGYYGSDVPSWSGDERLMEPEIEMMQGRIISLQPEQLITYDTKRNLSGYYFENWNIERYTVENPHYDWVGAEELDLYWGVQTYGWMEQVTGWISIPTLYERGRSQSFYTLEDTDKLICSSSMAHGYYYLERCEEEPAESYPEWSSNDSQKLLQELYGKYRVVEFLPTKDYNDQGSDPSKEEVDLMLGKTITVTETLFVTYDNYYYFFTDEELRQGLWEAVIGKPKYRVKTTRAEDIYGIRDGILTGALSQQEYVEIDVYPGYYAESYNLPQLYLLDDGRVIMCSMGEYFLLEKTEGPEEAWPIRDLSDWAGRYVYLEEYRKYEMEIREKTPGEYEAEIAIEILGQREKTVLMADIYPGDEYIQFLLRECLSEDSGWNDSDGAVLFMLRRDKDTGEIFTYWWDLRSSRRYTSYIRGQGNRCFEKEAQQEDKCEAFLGMSSCELPPSESEGALPQQEDKCEAFLGMSSCELPPSESEGASKLSDYYGTYRIKDFYYASSGTEGRRQVSSKFYSLGSTGQIVHVKPTLLAAITRVWPDGSISKCETKNPGYKWEAISSVMSDMVFTEIFGSVEQAEEQGLGQLDGLITINNIKDGYKSDHIYTFTDKNKLLFSMDSGVYLLERCGENEQNPMLEEIRQRSSGEDLSEWIGRYTYDTSYSDYEIEIFKDGQGEYYAEIEIGKKTITLHKKIRAYVCEYGGELLFIFKEVLSEKQEWEENRLSDILLRFTRDADTGEIYTIWGELGSESDSGKICFVKE